jgi:hypothetical protein
MLLTAYHFDVSAILDRLAADKGRDEHETGGSFHHNRAIILGAYKEEQLFVLSTKPPEEHSQFCEAEDTFGFLVGDPPRGSIDILQVWHEYRGKGIGREAANEFGRLALTHRAIGLRVQCSPAESEGFWRSIGFRDDDVPSGYSRQHVELWRECVVPAETGSVRGWTSVSVELFGHGSHTDPSATISVEAKRSNDAVRLRRKVVASSPRKLERMRVRCGDDVWFDQPGYQLEDYGVDRIPPWYVLKILRTPPPHPARTDSDRGG